MTTKTQPPLPQKRTTEAKWNGQLRNWETYVGDYFPVFGDLPSDVNEIIESLDNPDVAKEIQAKQDEQQAQQATLTGTPAKTLNAIGAEEVKAVKLPLRSLADFPAYVPEENNPDILVKGRWLERGGSAFLVSTAGTGKSIWMTQFALCVAEGVEFSGLKTNLKHLNGWVFQTEDSPSRVVIDREDITAELAEQYPGIDWRATWNRVKFFENAAGMVGADFIKELDRWLNVAALKSPPELPDYIIINPLMSFIGGDLSNSKYVTPFFRGGEIIGGETIGLQAVLEKYGIGALIAHHTSKPPTDKELEAWLKSPFPEYQCAGSADITNWGRSFITMMKVIGHPDKVCLTAGKGGGELGWPILNGARRIYLGHSKATSITGMGSRHGWHKLADDELAEISGMPVDYTEQDAARIVEILKKTPMTHDSIEENTGLTRDRFRKAWNFVKERLSQFGLATATAKTGRGKHIFIGGTLEAANNAARECERKFNAC